MPHLPKPINKFVNRVGAYVEHNKAKHNAAKPANVIEGQKDFDLGHLALWAKDLTLKGDGGYSQVRVAENRFGEEFVTTKKYSPASLLERKKLLPSGEAGQRMKATLQSARVQELVAADPELKPHVNCLLQGLGKGRTPPTRFQLDTRRQEAVLALGVAHLGKKAPDSLKQALETLQKQHKQTDDYHAAWAQEKELNDLLQVVNDF